ncbi:hypothetical protein CEXT_171 [Caerostris extrusa]|uniref:Uncharacterized protein n=1 Tax=Caerostris extrusa TaxID=172846 RepID=A0AAV4XQD6_CAEEX|nr:hypothetical protein CEXT_171 [Caerostris extrusa]
MNSVRILLGDVSQVSRFSGIPDDATETSREVFECRCRWHSRDEKRSAQKKKTRKHLSNELHVNPPRRRLPTGQILGNPGKRDGNFSGALRVQTSATFER